MLPPPVTAGDYDLSLGRRSSDAASMLPLWIFLGLAMRRVWTGRWRPLLWQAAGTIGLSLLAAPIWLALVPPFFPNHRYSADGWYWILFWGAYGVGLAMAVKAVAWDAALRRLFRKKPAGEKTA